MAGGRSERFGDADKAVASLAGTPLIRRVADRVAGPLDELVVNCRAGQRDAVADALDGVPLPVTYALDDEPDRGPLAGMRAGLRATDAPFAFVVACDAPFVDPGFVRYLFDRARAHDAAVPRRDGYREPLHAVYRVSPAVRACERALDAGRQRADAALADLSCATVTDAEVETHAAPGAFENVNTRADLERAAERL